MKPCRDVETIQRLIEAHRNTATDLTDDLTFHIDRIKMLEEYIYELQKPGFKVNGWIKLKQSARIEPYVITAPDLKGRETYYPEFRKHKK